MWPHHNQSYCNISMKNGSNVITFIQKGLRSTLLHANKTTKKYIQFLIQTTISLEMPVPSQGHYGFHSLFTTVITFCQFLYEVSELCFTVCLLQLLLFASSCMKSMSCVSKVITVVNKLWNTTHRLHTRTGKK
jgi:hypothetical protein